MPRKKIKVRDHKRRKPRKEDRIHVDEYERTVDLAVPRGSEREFLGARTKFEDRSARSQVQDLHMEAEETGFINDKEHVQAWKKAPNEYDIIGVDDPTYGPVLQDLPTVRALLKARLEGFKVRTREIVKTARAESQKVSKSKAPAKEKKKRLARIRETAKRDIKKTDKEERKVLDRVKEKVAKVSRASKKWSPERRRRANYVADTVGCSVIEADQLIRRARSKDVDYDRVDWDAIQGTDLEYTERVEKLEKQVGETYLEGEFESMIRAHEEVWELERAQGLNEVDRVTSTGGHKMEAWEEPPDFY